MPWSRLWDARWVDLIVPDDLKRDAGRTAQAAQAGRHTSIETERVRSDGSRVHVSELRAPITVAGASIAGYAIYRDITERRLAEAERTKLESRLRQAEKLEAIGTMAGGIAHDFSSILTAILGYGEMARSAAPETGMIRRYVSNVLSAANRAKALVDQILTYSRTTRGKHSVVNPRVVVQETLSLVRASLPIDVELKSQLIGNSDYRNRGPDPDSSAGDEPVHQCRPGHAFGRNSERDARHRRMHPRTASCRMDCWRRATTCA